MASDVKARLDTSGYNKDHPLPIGVNKNVIGLMKDELGGRIITEFVALRPKLYAYKTLGRSGDKRCKGVKKCIVKKTLDFEDYKQCPACKKQLLFRNKLHEVHTTEVNKLVLSRDDDKRVVRDNGMVHWHVGRRRLQPQISSEPFESLGISIPHLKWMIW